ncbi:DnaJ domain-containing protein [Flavobacterium sp. JAS]|uniref:DnaJ domain-containing protein n=1 Tax=Flavobacterium sp. JAS TaxID=2897329 RepID=UPI001E328490|nr:DnaJ domain-containing protein [Flavobacterium sp. JAS]MCD0472509.1 DnaJ domain-containing protein [Flavobacterium sp. JAS]
MNIKEAFEILNLSQNSSKEEVKEAHRNLIKKFHPRAADENHNEAAVINNARDIVIQYFEQMENNISLVKQVVEIMNVDRAQTTKQNEYKLQTDAIFNKVSRKYGSKYKKLQSEAKLVAAITGTLALLSSNILPIIKTSSAKDVEAVALFGFMTFAIGAYYIFLNSKAERIKDSLEELKDFLNDKANYYEIFNSILLYRNDKSTKITRNEFESLIYNWINDKPIRKNKSSLNNALAEMFNTFELGNFSLKDLVKKIGYNDFSRLIISTGLEKNIMSEEEVSLDGVTRIEYVINTKSTV